MSKLVYISASAAPHQVKFCDNLNQYFATKFYYYESIHRNREAWCKVPLSDSNKVLDNVYFTQIGKYFSPEIKRILNKENPSVLMLGGFTIPSNYLAYRWAKKRGVKTIVFTEISRDDDGNKRKFGLFWKFIKWLYSDVNYVFTANEDAKIQFSDDFGFGKKVVKFRYASDLDSHISHPIRESKPEKTILFANRLTSIYQPLLALDIFSQVVKKHPNTKMLMNNKGELKQQCIERIEKYDIEDKVKFIDDIKSWDDLNLVYKKSDILILPASFSNGNFTINEAMASGMGIIISNNVNGHSDTLRHKENCFIVDADVESFVSAIEEYFNNDTLFRVHGSINKKKIEPLSISGTARHFNELLNKLNLI